MGEFMNIIVSDLAIAKARDTLAEAGYDRPSVELMKAFITDFANEILKDGREKIMVYAFETFLQTNVWPAHPPKKES
jgi:hypothetical protein